MKVRCGFVTNSSSSSFILGFKDDADIDKFRDYCYWLGYEEFYKLIHDLIENNGKIDKTESLDLLWRYYSSDISWNLSDQKVKEAGLLSGKEEVLYRIELEKTPEFKEKVKRIILETTDYLKKKKEIEDYQYIVTGEIWDTNGGLLEWAIRNGFIESEFSKYCVLVWNVG